jgi:hypothetical protein
MKWMIVEGAVRVSVGLLEMLSYSEVFSTPGPLKINTIFMGRQSRWEEITVTLLQTIKTSKSLPIP